MKKLILGTLLAIGVCSQPVMAVDLPNYRPAYALIDNPLFPTEDLAVATVNVLDYGMDNTGATDCTELLQKLLDKVAGVGGRSDNRGDYRNICGGVVYMPEGTYLFKGEIVIPVGVTLRGDWLNPVDKEGVSGTVLKIEPREWNDSQERSFIVMQPCTFLSNLSFWYPDQNVDNVRPAPPTVLFGAPGFWGNEYCTVRRCTFVNSYTAIKFNANNGGGCPNIFDIYGTPLSYGVVMDGIADVGRFDGMTFTPEIWEKSSLPGAPAADAIRNYLRANAVGISMRRNDWSYTCNLSVDSYKVGFLGEASPVEPTCYPNGHNYNFTLSNCATGVELRNVSYPGIMFTKVSTRGCDTGVRLLHSGSGPVNLFGCEFNDTKAVEIAETSASQLIMQECDVKGAVHLLNGHFQAVASTFASDVFVSAKARTIFRGNKFTGNAALDNHSLFECQVSDEPLQMRRLPEFSNEWMSVPVTRPAREALYVVEGLTPLAITDNLSSAPDCTPTIQARLNEAGAAGGGIVYLPPGHYRMDGALRIPAGVELKGASDLPNVPHGQGSVFEVINGRNDENGTPFITMDAGSGLRGVVINYPNQKNSSQLDKYPYSIRGNRDCYIVNVSMRAAYRGVDLFTNKCDNHYVDYLGGHAFANVIRVGGNSVGGTVSNVQFNTIAYARGDETKFGQWPNSVADRQHGDQVAYYQNMRELDFFIIGDCSGEILYNNFLFGCNKGMHFVNDGNGGASACHAVGNAVDGAVNTFVIEGVASDLDLVNSQVVALNSDVDGLDANFITLGEQVGQREVTLFSSNHWGSGKYFCTARSGTVNLYGAHADECGRAHTFDIAPAAKVNLFNSIMDRPYNFTAQPGVTEGRLHTVASTTDATNANIGSMATWQHNLPTAWNFVKTDIFLSREGWKVTAFNDPEGTNPISKEGAGARSAVDGDASTRWDSRGSQAPGQWFAVDFGKDMTFNTLVLDTSGSANDGPAGYTVEAYSDGGWHTVASGSDAGAMLVATFPETTASRLRINQTGSKSNYWSIHELNLANASVEAPEISTGIEVATATGNRLWFSNGMLHLPDNAIGAGVLEVYSVSGIRVAMAHVSGRDYDVSRLAAGMYVAIVRTSEAVTTLKFVVR